MNSLAYIRLTKWGREVWFRHDSILAMERVEDATYLTLTTGVMDFVDQTIDEILDRLVEATEYM